MNLFLDTNAVIKLYHEEIGSDNLLKLLHTYQDLLIITISDLTIIEYHSALLKRVRMKELDSKRVTEIFKFMDNDLSKWNIIEVNQQVKSIAKDLLDSMAPKMSLSTLDALQVSTAIISNQMLKVDLFISSDKKLLKVAREYFKVFNPDD